MPHRSHDQVPAEDTDVWGTPRGKVVDSRVCARHPISDRVIRRARNYGVKISTVEVKKGGIILMTIKSGQLSPGQQESLIRLAQDENIRLIIKPSDG